MGINQEKKWQPYRIGDVASIKNGFAFKSTDFQSTGIPLIRQSQLREDDVDLSEAICLDEKFLTSHKDYLVKKDDVLLGMSGSIGKISYYKYDYPALQNQRVGKLDIKDKNILSKKFFLSFLMHKIDLLVEKSRGMGVQNISSKDIESIEILLPDIDIQHRIVEKIETLFSELDNSVANLKAAKAQLKRYRQSVLKSAFEGKLTVAWREANGDKLETVEALMERIKAEREAAYASKSRKPKELAPLTADEIAELPELPKGWKWTRIGKLANVATGATPLKNKFAYYENGSVPWVTSGALNESKIYKASDFVTALALQETNIKLFPKHTLLVAMYGEGKTRGKCAELMFEATTNQAVAALVQYGTEAKTRYFLKYYMQLNYENLRAKASGGAQPNLNLDLIKNTLVPLASLEEQHQIVNEIESRLSEADVMERTIDESLIKAEKMRQSILKKAFEGKLC